MPRRMRSSAPGSRVEKICGRQLYTNTISTTTTTVNIAPVNFVRALAIADVFQFYRFTKLHLRITPYLNGAGTVNNGLAAGYAPGAVFDTPPASVGDVVQLPIATYHGSAKTIDTLLNIPKKELLGDAQLPWFKTIAGTPDAQFEIQGNVYLVANASTIAVQIVIDYEVEFQSWNVAGNSPLRKVPALPPPLSSKEEKPEAAAPAGYRYVLLPELTSK